MPILEEVHDDSPLQQGDVLRDVALYTTAHDWPDDGGSALLEENALALVISRPCAIEHKKAVVVAKVVPVVQGTPKEVICFKTCKSFLADLRDGKDAPDRFYLGTLPSETDRYHANLDSLHTVTVPSLDVVTQYRVARLNEEFVRALHTRLFAAYASMGFHDVKWFDTADLQMMVRLGRADLATMEAAIGGKQSAIDMESFGKPNPRKVEGLQKELDNLVAKKEEMAGEVAFYEVELKARALSSAQLDPDVTSTTPS
jgi:hypothetical protein